MLYEKKFLALLIAATMTVAFVPLFAFAEESISNETQDNNCCNANITMCDDTDVINNATFDQDGQSVTVKKVIINESVSEAVKSIVEIEEIDEGSIEFLSEAGSISISEVSEDYLLVTVDIDEPIVTTVYDNNLEIEEHEKVGLLVENETDFSTKDYIDLLENAVAESKEGTYFSLFEKIFEPVYAYPKYTKETEDTKSSVTLIKRIIYYKATLGGSAHTWYQLIRSSSKIKSSSYTLKSLQMTTTYKGWYQNSPDNGAELKYNEGSKTGSKHSPPEKKKWYKLSSPTSKWYNEYARFEFKTKTVIVIKKNNKSETLSFTIKLTP